LFVGVGHVERVKEEVEQERVREGVRNSEGRLRGECRRRRPKAQGLGKGVGGSTERRKHKRVCIYGACVLHSSSTNNKPTTKPRQNRELDREEREREREREEEGLNCGRVSGEETCPISTDSSISLCFTLPDPKGSLSITVSFFPLFILPCLVSTSHLFHFLLPSDLPVMEFPFFLGGILVASFKFAALLLHVEFVLSSLLSAH